MKRDITKDRAILAVTDALDGTPDEEYMTEVLRHYIDRAEAAEKRVAELEREANHRQEKIDRLLAILAEVRDQP